ncbi:MAG: excinuclease ABC subunit UvrA [Ignavibacteriae bacterium]|jgi:excinuclease ABC subunit A|nr:excinuclease ABC subunit UvrA [Ignavibacteriota bacterium]
MPKQSPQKKHITITHARVNNLKDISCEIPRNALTVISGVSGSGKSSLAFETLYAEGQRRFVESLSSYARQFLDRMNKPDVESITGLPPAIAIEQRGFARNPRSTVATQTEIYDYLRLLYGRIGTTICTCGREVRKDTPAHAASVISEWNEGDRLYILFPIHIGEHSFEHAITSLIENGFYRAVMPASSDIIDLQEHVHASIEDADQMLMLGDRIIIKKDEAFVSRLTESLETAFSLGHGRVTVRNISSMDDACFSNVHECAFCNIEYQEPEPRLFSFNSPFGACKTCQGFGRSVGLDTSLVIPDMHLSLQKGAIHPFRTAGFTEYHRDSLDFARRHSIPDAIPYSMLTERQRTMLWEGDALFPGINGFFAYAEEKAAAKVGYRVLLSRYRGYTTCHECNGARLRKSARRVFIAGKTLPEIIRMTIAQAFAWFDALQVSESQFKIAEMVLKEIHSRLRMLVEIGLEYITLDRMAHTLSGGESQRITLATSLGSSLVGTLYVLDEPSIGLHHRDTWRLMQLLKRLRSLGNTVVVVEHDPEIIASADHVIDIGPKAGELGGEIMFSGTVKDMLASNESLTGQYLSGKKNIDIPKKRSKGNGHFLEIIEPKERNLKGDTVSIPLGCITVVTGVSGSGKSTLVHEVLAPALKKKYAGFAGSIGACKDILGAGNLQAVEIVDQSPIGKSSRSTPVTYTKAFDAIRDLFAETPASKQLGWRAGHFSFNVPGGRCETCEGEGSVTVEMQFLPDITLPCESCKGTRYKKEARDIHYKGASIVDVLGMTVHEALAFFAGNKRIINKLQVLSDVGLGYVRLGQPSTKLSGGEAQRIKLATAIDDSRSEKTLFVFDEPTTGLHLDDINTLLMCFRALVEKGHSVIIIEHHLNIIAAADYVIDLGPEAGEEGGYVIASGTPEEIMKEKRSHTGKALKTVLI